MLLEEFAYSAYAFRLHPYPEFYAVFRSGVREGFQSVRKLCRGCFPVSEGCPVVVARIFLPEPAVVHDKKLSTHGRDVLHHLFHSRLRDIEIDSFPAVEQDVPCPPAVVYHPVPRPSVEVSTHSAKTFVTVGQGKRRGGESLSGVYGVLRHVRRDAGREQMVHIVVRAYPQLIVPAPAQCGPYCPSVVLLRFPVEGEHDFRMGEMRVSGPVHVLYHQHSRIKRFLGQPGFISPVSAEMRHPHVSTAHVKASRIESNEGDRLFFKIFELCPCLYHIGVFPALVED